MNKFVWVEKASIDPKGEWLKVKIETNTAFLCERKDYLENDVIVLKSDVLDETNEQLF